MTGATVPTDHIPPALSVRGLAKHFGGVAALSEATFSVAPGEVLGLVGANGAGKSTLINILTGQFPADSGDVLVGGRTTSITSPRGASRLGIGVVRQALDLVPDLELAENIFLGDENDYMRHGQLDRPRMRLAAEPLLRQVGLDLDPAALVRHLSIGDQQLVAAARAVRLTESVLLLDEPTSSLTTFEAQRLFTVVGSLSAQGISVIFVSHRLDEVVAVCSRIVVLRDGRTVGEFPATREALPGVVQAMVPGSVEFARRAATARRPEKMLEAYGVVVNDRPPVHLTVHAGEVVGIFGLVGAGKSSLARFVAGLHSGKVEEMRIEGKNFLPRSSFHAYRNGVAYLSEDRRTEGILGGLSVRSNLVVRTPADTAPRGVLRRDRISRLVKQMSERLQIKTASDRLDILSLSGGNQQKVLLGRLLAEDLRLLILDEPTHGIDVRAKRDVLRIVEELTESGVAILMISSEIPELTAVCDRIIVMQQGRVTDQMLAEEATETRLMAAATQGEP